MKIAILGGGLASMYAVLACNEAGIVPDVYVKDFPSTYGTVYLKNIPNVLKSKVKPQSVKTIPTGKREYYIKKQWRDAPEDYKSSFPEREFELSAFNPAEVSKEVFEKNRCKIIKCKDLTDQDVFGFSRMYDFVFKSFRSKTFLEGLRVIGAIVKFPCLVFNEGYMDVPNLVVYDGTPSSFTTRISFLFGKKYIELSPRTPYTAEELSILYPGAFVTYIEDIAPISDPIKCTDNIPNVISIGRIATMKRSMLAEDSFDIVKEKLNVNI